MRDTYTDVDGTTLDTHASDDGIPYAPPDGLVTSALVISGNRLYVSGAGTITGTAKKRYPRHRRNYAIHAVIVRKTDNNIANAGPMGRLSRSFAKTSLFGRHATSGTDNWNMQLFRTGAFMAVGSASNQTLVIDQDYLCSLEFRGGRVVLRVDGVLVSQGDSARVQPNGDTLPGIRITDTDGSPTTGLLISEWMVTR